MQVIKSELRANVAFSSFVLVSTGGVCGYAIGKLANCSRHIRGDFELYTTAESDRALQDIHKLCGGAAKLLYAGRDDKTLPLLERALEIRENIL